MATDKMDSMAVYKLFEEIKKLIGKAPEIDMTEIKSITDTLRERELEAKEFIDKIDLTIAEVRKPVVSERRFIIDIVSKEVVLSLMICIVLIILMAVALYFKSRPNYDRDDNDLKYRYIKMKGEASSARISELEEWFEITRDNAKIKQLRKDIEDYERAIKEKATLDEQTRLRQLEAEKLNDKAKILKEK